MDRSNLRSLRSLAPKTHHHKIRLFGDLDPEAPGENVPDPYYGGADRFDEVLDIVTRTCRVMITELQIAERR